MNINNVDNDGDKLESVLDSVIANLIEMADANRYNRTVIDHKGGEIDNNEVEPLNGFLQLLNNGRG